jgi:hypothetical protein
MVSFGKQNVTDLLQNTVQVERYNLEQKVSKEENLSCCVA